jgi:hypothetical protein
MAIPRSTRQLFGPHVSEMGPEALLGNSDVAIRSPASFAPDLIPAAALER